MSDKYFGRLSHGVPANKKQIKAVLNSDRQRTLQLFEQVFGEKIAYDIMYILERGWAGEISGDDLYHGHASFRRSIPLVGKLDEDLTTIVSENNIDLNYHTREYIEPRGNQWNIYSAADGCPMVIPLDKYVRGLIYFHFNFFIDQNGKYSIEVNGHNIPLSIEFIMMK